MPVKSNDKAKRPNLVLNLETKFKIIPKLEAGKGAVEIIHENGILSTPVETVVADKINKHVAKLPAPGTIKCLTTRDDVLMKMEKLLTWRSDKQAKLDNTNSTFIRHKAGDF